MSSSTPTRHGLPKFLLDENVRRELFNFLKEKGFNTKLAPQSATDKMLAALAKREKRVLVTNDRDFCTYSQEKIFSVVWLRLPQNNPEILLGSFTKLLALRPHSGQAEFDNFAGRLIELKPKTWENKALLTEKKQK